MKSLNEDLKTGNFKQVYLLYGEESYLKRQFKKRFIEGMIQGDDTMNYTYFEGKGIAVEAVIESADTMPFFSDCRLIILENSGFFKSGDNPLVDYLKEVPETTRIIFIEDKISKNSKMYNAVKKYGSITELSYQKEDTLRRWISNRVSEEGKEMEPITIHYFLQKVGVGMENIHNELTKLFAYVGANTIITKSDIDEVCITQIEGKVFELTKAVAEKNSNRALELYYDLLDVKEPPMRILSLMAMEFRRINQVKELVRRGFNPGQIAGKSGINQYFIRDYIKREQRFTKESLRNILEEIAILDRSIKIGKISDRMAVEVFIVQTSSAEQTSSEADVKSFQEI
jgi:DNA polymerase-3 subunit delta